MPVQLAQFQPFDTQLAGIGRSADLGTLTTNQPAFEHHLYLVSTRFLYSEFVAHSEVVTDNDYVMNINRDADLSRALAT